MSSSDDDLYCPALPPHLTRDAVTVSKQSADIKNDMHQAASSDSNSRPIIGPELPSSLKNFSDNVSDNEDDFCPDLPPHMKENVRSVYGPKLPPPLKDFHSPSMEKNNEFALGYHDCSPSQPSRFSSCKPNMKTVDETSSSESEDDAVIGPMPSRTEFDQDKYIENIFNKKSNKTEKESSKLTRESWMLELPEDRPITGLGLKARQFARREKIDRGDTSVWTDTPTDKVKKKKIVEGSEQSEAARSRDESLQKIVDEYNASKRSAPLVETHRAAKKEKILPEDALSVTGTGIARKPFNREDDLHVNKFDEAQKASVLKKAKQLNDRFSSGKLAKFL